MNRFQPRRFSTTPRKRGLNLARAIHLPCPLGPIAALLITLLTTSLALAPHLRADTASAPAPSPLSRRLDPQGLLHWQFKGRPLFVYAFASNQFKPYVRELRSLEGVQVLRDAPADHLHHHGLMYAVRINGVNFWEETGQPGHQLHRSFLAESIGTNPHGLPEATFTELIHWVPDVAQLPTNTESAALLIERRTLTLTVDEPRHEVTLRWQAAFAVGPRTNQITIHGSEYNGLGLRLPADWDRVAQHRNSEGTPFPGNGKPSAMRARWSCVSLPDAHHSPQVSLFARPTHPTSALGIFAMTEPFTYLAATQLLDQTPIRYKTGDTFTLDYLLRVSSTPLGAAELEKNYESWISDGERKER